LNIFSINAQLTKNFVAYATNKAALSGMTKAMAVNLGWRDLWVRLSQ
jgi:NAD(P)-dependent dehydrogenase (short-subunit alcohol dehydrogenase family)